MLNQKFSNSSSEYGRFMDRTDTPPKVSLWEMLSVIKEILFDAKSRTPQGKLPEVRSEMLPFLVPGETLKFIWFGHSTLLLNMDGQTILIDPVFSKFASPINFINKRFQPAVITLEELPPIDDIVISHNHYDHLDKKTIKFFRNKATKFIVPLGVGKHLRDWGISSSRISELNWGESLTSNALTYTAAPARHFSGRGLFDSNKTLWASWVIQGKLEKIFYSGDSSYSNHFKEIGNRFGPFDLAFIENGQYDKRWIDAHMLPEETIQAVIDLKARTFVPVHWGMFDMAVHNWSEPVKCIYKLAKTHELPIITPRFGEVVEIISRQTYFPWWESLI
ncbi:MBL fold metallo-hydrolase [Desulfosporosinus sp. SB140]|uniref:MBL fold metallo-hydrolase n=1 Tax=Desulfosporosinus paludis TaxID=3115649 RepID=UPI00388FD548